MLPAYVGGKAKIVSNATFFVSVNEAMVTMNPFWVATVDATRLQLNTVVFRPV